MKKGMLLAGLAFAAVLASSAPAGACGFFCKVGNFFSCGDPSGCGSSNSNKPTAPAPAPAPAAQAKAQSSPNSSSPNSSSPNSGSGGSTDTPPAGSGPVVVVPKPVAPPPGGAPVAPNPPAASGGGGDSTQFVNKGTGGMTPGSEGSIAGNQIQGGGEPPMQGPTGPNTTDLGDVAGHMVAVNDGVTANNASMLAGDVGARQAGSPAAASLAAAGLPAGLAPQMGAKPLEQNIYKTVGAIPGMTEAKTPEAQAALIAKSMMANRQLGDWDRVLSDASSLIAVQPNNGAAYMRRAEAFNHLKRYADAERDGLAATHLDPTNADAWKQLAWAQLRQGKFTEAQESASHAIALNANDAEAYMMRAYAREGLGDLVGRLRDAAMAAMLDHRFKEKYEIAKAGGAIFNAEEDDDVLLGASPTSRKLPASPLAGGLALGALAVFLAGGAYAGRKFLKSRAAPAVEAAASAPAAAPAPEIRKITTGSIIGKYQLGHIVGRGGMGQVFEATDLSLSRPVAVKKMTDQVAQLGPQARQLFLKEARTVAQLHHPAIVEIYEILEEGSDLFMVFELVSGKTAQQLLVESGRLPLPRVLDLLRPVCEALDFAHGRALVHRDLKPGNIMLTEQGHVKLMDFGIARTVGDNAPAAGGITASFGRTSIIAGTPEYRAPEAEAGIVCKEGDVYSLGVSAYELLTGRIPYSLMASAEDKAAQRFAKASALAPGLPPAVDDVLSQALQASPERRLKTPGEFINALTAALGTPAA